MSDITKLLVIGQTFNKKESIDKVSQICKFRKIRTP